MTTGLIVCGALGREISQMVAAYGWDARVIGIPAIDHAFPERIAPHVEERILAWRERCERLIVVFGDCGTRGALDALLKRYPDIERIPGPHCYEMYAGESFATLMEEEPGTFFLTDFMVRTFDGLILKSMGLDRYPDLKDEYFRNYRRVVFLTQSNLPPYRQKARQIAAYLGLPLEIRPTGWGELEKRLVERIAATEKR
ncbi:MAG: DUF1638 domain-containing protein [Anaerolineae bacterium]|nr:MAG: DUF1638 domain-containing protein [Anaerolineae bacterium]